MCRSRTLFIQIPEQTREDRGKSKRQKKRLKYEFTSDVQIWTVLIHGDNKQPGTLKLTPVLLWLM